MPTLVSGDGVQHYASRLRGAGAMVGLFSAAVRAPTAAMKISRLLQFDEAAAAAAAAEEEKEKNTQQVESLLSLTDM